MALFSDPTPAGQQLETLLEDDGFPISIFDLDEDAGIDEVSVYAEDEPEGLEARIADVLKAHAPGATLERENLDDIDWVTKSLEGLKPVRVGRFLVHGAHDRGQRRIGDLAIASMFVNLHHAGEGVDARRWPKLARYVAAHLVDHLDIVM